MFDFGKANEGQQLAIKTADGPYLSQQGRVRERPIPLFNALSFLFKNGASNQNKS